MKNTMERLTIQTQEKSINEIFEDIKNSTNGLKFQEIQQIDFKWNFKGFFTEKYSIC